MGVLYDAFFHADLHMETMCGPIFVNVFMQTVAIKEEIIFWDRPKSSQNCKTLNITIYHIIDSSHESICPLALPLQAKLHTIPNIFSDIIFQYLKCETKYTCKLLHNNDRRDRCQMTFAILNYENWYLPKENESFFVSRIHVEIGRKNYLKCP